MPREHALRTFGIGGLVVGATAFVTGPFTGELGSMLAGYGLLMVLSAGYLLAGLAIRDRIRRRTRETRPVPVYGSQR